MDCEIREISPEMVRKFGREIGREHVDFKTNENSRYLGAFDSNGRLVGVVGWQNVGNSVRYKTDAVLKEERGRGIYSRLFDERDRIVGENVRKKAFCTQKSIWMYIKKHGFHIVRVNSNNITFVEK